MTELIDRIGTQFGRRLTEYDLRCVKLVHQIKPELTPAFCVQPKFASMQYSDAFIEWLEEQHKADPEFFEAARSEYYKQTKSG